jgi:hypothetical protein
MSLMLVPKQASQRHPGRRRVSVACQESQAGTFSIRASAER